MTKKLRQEDQLAGMVMAECRKRGIAASVIHSKMSQDSYKLVNSKNGDPEYIIRNDMRRVFRGYLSKVALNHVLLNNERWPFVLSTPTNADITIGIDVKYNTAGLLLVGARGQHIRILRETSKQKEQLSTKQLQAYLVKILKEELDANTKPIKHIVIHRDGRMFDCELKGCKAAIQQLIQTGKLDVKVELTVIEIPKTSPARVRLFEIGKESKSREYTNNPHVGDYHIVGDEGYVCSTGWPFLRHGTAKPLHAKKVYGALPIKQCLEDIYHLTTLTWSMPEGCARFPITIRLNDRFLREIATGIRFR